MRHKFIFCSLAGLLFFAAVSDMAFGKNITGKDRMHSQISATGNIAADKTSKNTNPITIFMCGDVMIGRGIDQILPYPGDPTIHESYMKSARGYVQLAEAVNGPIDYPVGFSYIWGDALQELERMRPDVTIINLETSITESNDYWEGKGINYRMHPKNISSITAAGIDVCSLANNHVIDWGYSGLLETTLSLKRANIKMAGAGRNLIEAEAPAVRKVPGKGRVLVFAFGMGTSGVPSSWGASDKKPGVNLLRDLNDQSLLGIQKLVRKVKSEGDIVVASIHWGSNWGYDIAQEQTIFAHRLIDQGDVDIIHGHSSHHVRAIEVYKDKLILYGCGDFLNDYEGISGYEEFRADLSLMYFATVDPSTGRLLELLMTPTQIRRLKINRASKVDTLWLKDTINREGIAFGTKAKITEDNRLRLQWD